MNQLLNNQNNYDIYNVLNKNCMDYARYILKYRCIPDLRDGCKPIHKRIVYSFYKSKLTNDKPRAKSSNACGGVLAYSPHGDASVYEACVRLANDSVNVNLIDGKGSFSSHTSRDVYAGASRYTEMRLSKIANELLGGIEKNNVDFVPTYDEARLEPTVLPASFPLILCNPTIGIGMGISSSVASFNLNEVIDYTIKFIKNEKLPLLCPDFPTGAKYIYNENELLNVDRNGRGKLVLQAKYYFEKDSIVITEIPYSTTREAICEKILELAQNKVIKDIIDVNDYTGVKGLNITIDLKKNSNAQIVMNKLLLKTPLQDSFSCNFNVLDNGIPKLLGIKDIISKWVVFRQETIKREISYDLSNINKEKHLLLGLLKIIDVIDDIIKIIKESNNDKECIEKLIDNYKLTKEQAEYIIEIKLKSLNKEWIQNRTNKLSELEEKSKILHDKLENNNSINNIIISQLTDIKNKYGKPRKTEIIYEDTTQNVTKEEMIEDYNCNITLSAQGYIKKTRTYSENQKVKDEDSILMQEPCTNKSDILIFTNKANMYKLKAYELDLVTPSQLGNYLQNMVSLESGEKSTFLCVTNDYKTNILFAFANGKVTRVPLSSYQSKTKKLTKVYNTNSQLVFISLEKPNAYLYMESSINKILIVDHTTINTKLSKSSQGVNVMKSKNDSTLKLCKFIKKDDLPEEVFNYYLGTTNSVGNFLKKEHTKYIDNLFVTQK